jgi:glycosyltransferase involved in cell wall biosynthesis
MPDCVNADIFCATNFSTEEKAALKTQLGIPADKKLIVYLGVLTTYQGVDKLLEALKILREGRHDVHLLLMGYPAVARFQAHAEMVGVSDLVTFTGKVPYQEAPRYLALGDIAAAPKISVTEGSGKILNYMAMSLPTVAFNMPVSREFLGDGGIYATEINSSALAAALNRALDLTPDERNRLGQYLRQRVITHYSWERAIEQIEAVYQALLSGEPLPTANHLPATPHSLSENL